VLKTALKPRWIAALLLALVISSVFVLLSQWQFSRSTQTAEQPTVTTEEVKPLISIFKPGETMFASSADHVVSMTGRFEPGKQAIIRDRLQNGEKGYWVVDAFVVDGAPVLQGAGATPYTVIPVARGWIADPAQARPAPSGPLTLTGRLIPAEAPVVAKNLPEGQLAVLSTAELINIWQVSSYQGFVVSFSEIGPAGDVGAHAVPGDLKGISVDAQPPNQNFNWLNLFYAVEWIVFAGFSVFLWWRLVADDFRRENEPEFEDDFDDDPQPAGEAAAAAGPNISTKEVQQ
jgi:cytochrome oxidase assembly protein ShyY1